MSRERFIKSVSALDGRTDPNIQNYFVETAAIRNARDSSSSSFGAIGLKGSGKTTLYRYLVEDWEGNDASRMTVGLSTQTAAFEAYFDRMNCLQFERSVRTGMMLYILKLIDQNIKKFKRSDDLSDWIRRKDRLLNPQGRLAALLGRLEGLSIMGVDLKLQPGVASSFQPLTGDENEEIRTLIRLFGETGRRLRIVVDDPDRLFTRGINFDPHLLAGYILGTNWISDQFNFIEFVHVLKTSVYDTLWEVEEMANLPTDYFRYIGWERDELHALVEARLRYSEAAPSEIFEDTRTYSIDALCDRIRNGPRDLLRYLEIILKAPNAPLISEATIREHAPEFKHEARRQMESVYNDIFEGIDAFCASVFEERNSLSIAEFDARFELLRLAEKPPGVNYGQNWLKRAERALRSCLDAGLIDFQAHSRWITPFQPDYFRFSSREKSCLIRRNSVFVPE